MRTCGGSAVEQGWRFAGSAQDRTTGGTFATIQEEQVGRKTGQRRSFERGRRLTVQNSSPLAAQRECGGHMIIDGACLSTGTALRPQTGHNSESIGKTCFGLMKQEPNERTPDLQSQEQLAMTLDDKPHVPLARRRRRPCRVWRDTVLWRSAFLAGVLINCCVGMDYAQVKSRIAEPKTSRNSKEVNWNLLYFDEDAGPRREVTRIRIVLYKMKGPPLEEHLARREKFTFETRDSRLLDLATHFLHVPLRYAYPRDQDYDHMPVVFTAGHMIVTTNRDRFRVGITTMGFVLQSKQYDASRAFFSAGLAMLVDEVVFKQTGKHIPVLSTRLSGEEVISAEKGTYETITEVHNKGTLEMLPLEDETPREKEPGRPADEGSEDVPTGSH